MLHCIQDRLRRRSAKLARAAELARPARFAEARLSRHPGAWLLGAMVAAGVTALSTACSSQQLYGTGQNWQRQECIKLPDIEERKRCMASASRSYADYQRESQSGPSMR